MNPPEQPTLGELGQRKNKKGILLTCRFLPFKCIVQQSLCYTTNPPVADRWVIVSINYGAEFARPRGCKNARVYTPAPLAETRSF